MQRRRLGSVLVVTLVLGACGGPIDGDYDSLSQASSYPCSGSQVPGIDVSSYQKTIDWSKVAGAGYKWAYAKATEGTGYQDAYFAQNWSGMKTAGILRGAYHFFHPDLDGKTQADYFLAYAGPMGQAGDLPPMLDWEVTNGASWSTAIANAQAFINEIKAKTGLTTVIYASPGFLGPGGSLSQFSSDPLWEADWTYSTSSCPITTASWSKWTFWQWSDKGSVSGITTGYVDLDVFNGTLAQLQQMATAQTMPISQVSGNDAITLVNWPDKHMELFAKTPSGTEQHLWTSGGNDTWSGPATLDSGAECGSAASFWGGPWVYPELFSPLTKASSGHLWWTMGVGWNKYQGFGGTQLSHFATAVGLDGRTSVFALGSDKAIWTNYWDTTKVDWSGWASLGGSFVTGVGPITWGNGTIELFATDGAGDLWHKWSNTTGTAGWSAWTKMGSGMASRPVPVRWNDGMAGHAEVFVRGLDGQLYHSDYSYQNGWPGFTVLSKGSQIIGEVSALMNPMGAGANPGPEVFARDTFGNVLHLWWNGSSYTAFTPLDSQVSASDPFGWIRGDGSAEVFAIDQSGDLVRNHHDPSNGWTGWSSIGSGFDSCAAPLPPPPSMDAGMPDVDAGMPVVDAGLPVIDAGMPELDAGTSEIDAGMPEADAGVPEVDAGEPLFDAGESAFDAGIDEADASGVMDDAGLTDTTDAGTTDAGRQLPHPPPSGCNCGSGGTSPSAIVWLLLALAHPALRRRRRA